MACRDEQVTLLKSVVSDSADELQIKLAAVGEERSALKSQLTKQQQLHQQVEHTVGLQLSALKEALAQANARLKAAGGKPVTVPKAASGGTGDDAALDQNTPCRNTAPSVLGPRSPDATEEGPPTPLSPGQAPLPKAPGSSWDGSDGPLQPVLCCSPLRIGGKGGKGADAQEEEEEAEPLDSPRSDLSGPSCCEADDVCERDSVVLHHHDGCGSPTTYRSRHSMRASAAAFGNRLARDNPLFRCSGESRRTARALASVDGGSVLNASMDDAPLMAGSGAAAFGLAKAQLEIQVG